MRCHYAGCDKPATHMVFWITNLPVAACGEHIRIAEVMAIFLGIEPNIEGIKDDTIGEGKVNS